MGSTFPHIRSVAGVRFDEDLMTHCLSSMFDSRAEEANCLWRLQRHYTTLIALYGMNMSIASTEITDLAPGGAFFFGMLGANRSYDLTLGEFMMSLGRWRDGGVRFSNLIGTSEMVLITRAVDMTGIAPNLRIARQFCPVTLTGMIGAIIALVVLRLAENALFKRATIFGGSLMTNIAIVSLSLTVFYQAIISQYLLVQVPLNVELAVQRAMARATVGEGSLHFGGPGAIADRFLHGMDDISRSVQAVDRAGGVKYGPSYQTILERIDKHDDMFIVTHDVLSFMGRVLNDPSVCTRYQIMRLDTPSAHNALALSASLDSAIVEEINSRIAHRSEAIFRAQTRIADNLTDVCRRHFESDGFATVGFTHVRLGVVSGAFWLLAGMLLASTCALVCEMAWITNGRRECLPDKTIFDGQRDDLQHIEEQLMKKCERLIRHAQNDQELQFISALLDTASFTE